MLNAPQKRKKTTVLLVDDHALLRRGLADLIKYEPDLEVIGEAADGEAAIAAAERLNPDVIVMDLMMPVMDGVEATRRIKAAMPQTKILILTTFGTSADVARAVEAGASGAIMKDDDMENQLAAIRTAANGGKAFSPGIEKSLRDTPSIPKLTDKQRVILESVTRGLTNRDIATMLDISADAVKQHLAAIFTKIGAANRSEAVSIALRKHLLKL
jgi:DNA-binding NarL/FixJ family response regulator